MYALNLSVTSHHRHELELLMERMPAEESEALQAELRWVSCVCVCVCVFMCVCVCASNVQHFHTHNTHALIHCVIAFPYHRAERIQRSARNKAKMAQAMVEGEQLNECE